MAGSAVARSRTGWWMYRELDPRFQIGLDFAGDVTPEVGAVFGWVRHPATASVEITVDGTPGTPFPLRLLSVHLRDDVEAPPGSVVTGFNLVHENPKGAPGRHLVVRAGSLAWSIDLFTSDLPADPETKEPIAVGRAIAIRNWTANLDLLRESILAPDLSPLLKGDRPFGLFADWLDRWPSIVGAGDWVGEFRRAAAVVLPTGEVAIAGSFTAPAADDRVTVEALAVVTPKAGPMRAMPMRDVRTVGFGQGFALYGHIPEPAPGEVVQLIVSTRRDGRGQWLRAEAAGGEASTLMDILSLAGMELPASDQPAVRTWMEAVLAARMDALRAPIARIAAAGGDPPGWPATALVFDLEDVYAARLLGLLAPALEARFGRIVLSGAAAARAAAALAGRRLEVSVQPHPTAALLAASGEGRVVPLDTAALTNAAVEADLESRTGWGLDGSRLSDLALLHAMAGTGDLSRTLRRICAQREPEPEGALRYAPPASRGDAVGSLVAAHLTEIWQRAMPAAEGRA
ncbi:hypothetical protein [Muricoccus radiodurans]|uniref:hypothetical protein n=1 Tax=Muricoccus radiodurans TaxID=2231721 RepID=UPI003CE79F49